jgi:hypothetical protein
VFSLFPLFPPLTQETCTKISLLAANLTTTYAALDFALPRSLALTTLDWVYLTGMVAVTVFVEVLHPLGLVGAKWPFLPLLLMSSYSALGMVACFVQSYALLGSHARKKKAS